MQKNLVLCDCAGSFSVPRTLFETNDGISTTRVCSALCGADMAVAQDAISAGDAIITCPQEHTLFRELAEELGAEEPGFLDIRDRAGWSDEGDASGPKMAALLAESLLPAPEVRVRDVVSEGTCLILGPADVTLPCAEKLADTLAVTVLLTDAVEIPLHRRFDVLRGTLRRASGALGGFTVEIDAAQEPVLAGRGEMSFGPARDGARSECDIIIDLSGAAALFPAHEKREGYLRADPTYAPSVADATFAASLLVGTFEKPLYARLEKSLCAHSRAGQTGCTRCLDACPTGAILSAGDTVELDPMICAGCGSCAALCPSGAISFDAPPVSSIFSRLETLSRSYRDAGGVNPRLLVITADHGAEMVALSARFGRGLPADVIPFDLPQVSGFGHSEILAALACGFASVDVLVSPATERLALDRESLLVEAIAGPGKLRVLDLADPDALSDALFDADVNDGVSNPILPLGSRRQVTRLAAQALNPDVEAPIALPEGAPYGAVLVDTDACTLCLSCISLCPSGALVDNPDKPELRFQEDACLQCGICETICPEKAISLEPRLNLADAAFSFDVLNEEEPFACVECGALFGVKSTVEKITEKLAGTHAMFASSEAARMIQMCDDCRVKVQFHSQSAPFAAGERPRVRTSEDYLTGRSSRKDH